MPAKDEYRACGKQVLLNGSHYADACNTDASIAIAYAMNSVYLSKLGRVCRTCKVLNGHADNCVERGNE